MESHSNICLTLYLLRGDKIYIIIHLAHNQIQNMSTVNGAGRNLEEVNKEGEKVMGDVAKNQEIGFIMIYAIYGEMADLNQRGN